MRYKELLNEASGLRNSVPGETYVDATGVAYTFVNWNYNFPATSDRYESAEQTTAEAEQATQTGEPGVQTIWINTPTNSSKSFAFATFESQDGDVLNIGKFFQKKSPSNTIYDKDVKQHAGLTEYRAGAKSNWAVKAELLVKPKELGLTGAPRSVPQIIKTVGAHTHSAMLVTGLEAAATKKPIVFEKGAAYLQALQDDFGEVFAPIAMVKNNPVVTGTLQAAFTDVFGGENLAKAAIEFPDQSNNNLIDSYIVSPAGIKLGVSSKGDGGAQATVTVIYKAKEEARAIHGDAIIKKFKLASEVLDTIDENSAIMGPIVLAKQFGLAKDSTLEKLKAVCATKSMRMAEKYRTTGDLKQDLKRVPRELVGLFKLVPGYNKNSFIPNLCLAGLAKLVAQHINTDPKIKFGEAVKGFLNHSAMVQANAKMTRRGEEAVVTNISVVYPPRFKNKAMIESNSYHGRGQETKLKIKLPTA